MDDLISRQAAIDVLEGCQQYKVSTEDYAVDYAQAKTELMMLPSADVVEVVRCKDCIHWCNHSRLNIPWCRELHIDRGADDYCSLGEGEPMDDLISRYVSIEYVCAMMMRKGFRSKEMTISEFMDILKPSDVVSREAYEKVKLKSAQPSYTDEQIQKMQELEQAEIEKAFQLGREDAQSEIIRCKDCIYYDPARSEEEIDWCHAWCEETIEDGYCNNAERREDDN